MKILVVTNSCSAKKYEEVCKLRYKTIVDPQQKFFRLFIDGLSRLDGVEVEVLSALPVSASTVNQKRFEYETEVTETGTRYHYLPFRNGKFSRYLSLIHSVKKYTKKLCCDLKSENTYIITDALIPVLTIPCKRIAHKKKIKIGAIVTDIPSLATKMKNRKESFLKSLFLQTYQRISDIDLRSYDFYVPLTESINDVVNEKNRPYCVVEGFADSGDTSISETHENYVMYAGGVYEKYGVKNLVDAFVSLNRTDMSLKIFGDGSYVEELNAVCDEHTNVQYMGCVLPEQVVEYEKKALLLVNPRPTDENFAKYSFPSKTMEYLLSGTAVISTRLPGIPQEYFNVMYAFEDSSYDGILEGLRSVLEIPAEDLVKQGARGHDFVINEKNNVRMAEIIKNFLKDNASGM